MELQDAPDSDWKEGYEQGRAESLYEVYLWLDGRGPGVTLARILEDYRQEFGIEED